MRKMYRHIFPLYNEYFKASKPENFRTTFHTQHPEKRIHYTKLFKL